MSYAIEQFYRLFQGALVFQGIFFGIIFFLTKRKDIMWYALYLLAAAAYFFINASGTFFNIDENLVFESAWYNWINIPLIIAENLFYLLFIRHFFKDIVSNPQVGKVLQITLQSIPLLITVFLLLKIVNANTQLIFYTVNLLSILPAILIAITVTKHKLPYAILVANGLICMVTGTLLTVIMIYWGNNGATFLLAASYPLLFIRLGLLGDMFFYQLALLKKWRMQEKELLVQKLQTQLEVEKVRNRISAELHDDVGSMLSGISMYSHMAIQQAGKKDELAVRDSLQTIQQSSDEMVNRLKDMVWFNKQGAGSVSAMIERLKEYAAMMCRVKGIELKVATEEGLKSVKLTEELVYNIYLICKEAINNAVKYSGATMLSIQFTIEQKCLHITVKDNGQGFNIESKKNGNGLNNMQERTEQNDAILTINTAPGKGCTVGLQVKITQ